MKTLIVSSRSKDIKLYQKFLEENDNYYFQQSIFWAHVIESFGKDKFWVILVFHENKTIGALPLFVFKSKFGNIINSVPYSGPLGGIIIKNGYKKKKVEIYTRIFSSLATFAKKENAIAATLISSPFWPDVNLYRKIWKPTYDLENYTLYIDLQAIPRNNSHFRNNLKRMLKKAKNNGFKVIASTSTYYFNSWYKIHRLRHKELSVTPLPRKLLLNSIKFLVQNNFGRFFFIIDKNEQVVAGCLTLYSKRVIDTYIYSGSLESYKNGAMYLLIFQVMKWSKMHKFKYFNWQSSKPRGGGPYNFKVQWGSSEKPYFFFTKVFKSKEMQRLINLGLERIKKEYSYHFVLPLSILDKAKS
ncbi:MAG: hypothetical protein HY044_03025 [Candidatus Woesebacteria bacterium]|nr:MAG: hypothetical protein HY044_03025 [Candidatus Woesebacteria bacterium]